MKPVFLTLHYIIFLVIFDKEIHTKTRQTNVHLVYLIHSEEPRLDQVSMPYWLARLQISCQRWLTQPS